MLDRRMTGGGPADSDGLNGFLGGINQPDSVPDPDPDPWRCCCPHEDEPITLSAVPTDIRRAEGGAEDSGGGGGVPCREPGYCC